MKWWTWWTWWLEWWRSLKWERMGLKSSCVCATNQLVVWLPQLYDFFLFCCSHLHLVSVLDPQRPFLGCQELLEMMLSRYLKNNFVTEFFIFNLKQSVCLSLKSMMMKTYQISWYLGCQEERSCVPRLASSPPDSALLLCCQRRVPELWDWVSTSSSASCGG